jgi:hypothetical protein
MSVRGKWRVVETLDYDMAVAGSHVPCENEGGDHIVPHIARRLAISSTAC